MISRKLILLPISDLTTTSNPNNIFCRWHQCSSFYLSTRASPINNFLNRSTVCESVGSDSSPVVGLVFFHASNTACTSVSQQTCTTEEWEDKLPRLNGIVFTWQDLEDVHLQISSYPDCRKWTSINTSFFCFCKCLPLGMRSLLETEMLHASVGDELN